MSLVASQALMSTPPDPHDTAVLLATAKMRLVAKVRDHVLGDLRVLFDVTNHRALYVASAGGDWSSSSHSTSSHLILAEEHLQAHPKERTTR